MSGSRNYTGLTPSAQRTVARCRRIAAASAQVDPWSAYLVLTLLQDESLASACLMRLGITLEWLMNGELGREVARSAALDEQSDSDHYPGDGCQPIPSTLESLDDPLEFTRVLDKAAEFARRGMSDSGVSSANLLLAVVETNEMIRERFAAAGVTLQKIRTELYPEQVSAQPPLSVEDSLVFDGSQGEPKIAVRNEPNDLRVWRVVDANLNRTREGLRVLEDFARFVADDGQTSLQLKSLRHELVAAEKKLLSQAGLFNGSSAALSQRDTAGDVGTSQTTSEERTRGSLADVIVANCRRVQESLRSLEEFGKLLSPEFSASVKQLRYRLYTVEKSLNSAVGDSSRSAFASNTDRDRLNSACVDPADFSMIRRDRISRLRDATVYVLITESMCRLSWQQVVENSLDGGADVLQLREKTMADRELLRRALWIRDACRSAGALFIMNDRPDLAVVMDADGVHIGQDELTVSEARMILRPDQLVGVSTHNGDQASQAILDGADYIGVGPVFPSRTKSFDKFPGVKFVTTVASLVSKPWFPIGGVSLDLLSELMSAGASRVAVTSAVAGSDDPAEIVRQFKSQLNQTPARIKFETRDASR